MAARVPHFTVSRGRVSRLDALQIHSRLHDDIALGLESFAG
jgi:hypothetical protein